MKDMLRTLFSIRQQRKAPPVGSAPPVGASIICGRVKMEVTHAITGELWSWMVLSGWRNVPVKDDRRVYTELPTEALKQIIDAPPGERDKVYGRIMAKTRRET